jgi:PAS domain S-box-containing protein
MQNKDGEKPVIIHSSRNTEASSSTKQVRKAVSHRQNGKTDFPIADVTREKQSIDEITQVKTAQYVAECIIDTVPEPLIILDQDLRVVLASRSFYEVFKTKPEETVGQHIYDLGNKQWDIPKLRELLETILPQKTTFNNYEVEHVFATIGKRIMLLNARQIQRVLGKEQIILLAIEDITKRREVEKAQQVLEGIYHLLMEQALVISKETLHLVVESLIVGITVADLKGTMLQINQALVLLHGFHNKEEIIGRNILDLVDKADQISAKEQMNKVMAEGFFKEIEFTLLKADGSNFAAELSASIIKDSSGIPQGIVFITRDITERRRLEQERVKFTEEIKEKNTELERFTYTVSHDLKSPLVTIKTFLGYLKQDIAGFDTRRIEQDMLYMNGAADKMGNLLSELLEMSRIGRAVNPSVTVTFQELVQETLRLVAGFIDKCGVKVQVSDKPITLFGDRPRMVEIWQNLVENAAKFMGDQPLPLIDIGVEVRDHETVFFVQDNGIGIDPQYQPKLFNLFEKFNTDCPAKR